MSGKKNTPVPPVLCARCMNWPISIWRFLSPEEYEEIVMAKHYRRFRRGEFLFREGEIPENLYCIYSGKVKVVKQDLQTGEEVIVRLAQEGDLVGYRAVLEGGRYRAGAVAITDVSVCTFPVREVREVVRKNLRISEEFLRILAEDLRRAETRLKAMATLTVRERILHTLLFLEGFFGVDDEGFLVLPISRKELAQLVGTAPEVLARQMAVLELEGLIETEGARKFRILRKSEAVERLGAEY